MHRAGPELGLGWKAETEVLGTAGPDLTSQPTGSRKGHLLRWKNPLTDLRPWAKRLHCRGTPA